MRPSVGGAVADGRGRRSAGVDFGWLRLSGWPAWVLWSLAHVFYLSGLHNRFTVLLSWAWSYATFHRGSRLITGFKCARKDRAGCDWAIERVPEIPEGRLRYLDTQMSPLQSTVIVSPWTNRIMIRTAAIPAIIAP